MLIFSILKNGLNWINFEGHSSKYQSSSRTLDFANLHGRIVAMCLDYGYRNCF